MKKVSSTQELIDLAFNLRNTGLISGNHQPKAAAGQGQAQTPAPIAAGLRAMRLR